MERLIPGFMTYLMQVKNASKSTMSSYERDLKRLAAFLDAKGVHAPEDVTATSLNSYILFWNGKVFPQPQFPEMWLYEVFFSLCL